MKAIKNLIKHLSFLTYIADILLIPVTVLSGIWYRIVKFVGFSKAPITRRILHSIGVFPIVDHYYEPFFQFQRLPEKYAEKRLLPGIDWNDPVQLRILELFVYQTELSKIPVHNPRKNELSFYHENGSFSYADAEYLYSFIRAHKPDQIIEIGSGFSTRMMVNAIKENQKESHETSLLCIEPFEMPWLEKLPVRVLRNRVEMLDPSFFKTLRSGDILFIDSSHIIRPEGDVLFELFEILPVLTSGVFIHFHDILTPYQYPENWLKEHYRFWNEQYLLEAFLLNNREFEIIGGLRYLADKFPDQLLAGLPITAKRGIATGGSFWIRKR